MRGGQISNAVRRNMLLSLEIKRLSDSGTFGRSIHAEQCGVPYEWAGRDQPGGWLVSFASAISRARTRSGLSSTRK